MNKSFTRQCPKCEKTIYHTNKNNRNRYKKTGALCRSCSSKEIQNRPDVLAKNVARGLELKGDKNPFYGKHHSVETKDKIVKNTNRAVYKTDAYREKMSNATSGHNNPMAGISVYDLWVKKYGKEEADNRQSAKRQKASVSLSGCNNPMYGKTAPHGSGGGWSGWYKKWYFRSLRELAYILKMEENNTPFVSAEKKLYAINYTDEVGIDRTYRADFFVDGYRLVEIKPAKLQNTIINVSKTKAAIAHCREKGWVYVVEDIEPVSADTLLKLGDEVQLLPKWKERLCLMQNKK